MPSDARQDPSEAGLGTARWREPAQRRRTDQAERARAVLDPDGSLAMADAGWPAMAALLGLGDAVLALARVAAPSLARALEQVLGGERAQARVDLEPSPGRFVEVRASRLEGPGAGALVEVDDVTTRRADLARHAVYRAALAAASDAIGVIDDRGVYVEQNAAHRALVGYGDDELRGQTPAIHLGPEQFARVQAAVAAQGRFEGEVRSTRRDGRPVELELTALAVQPPAGGAPYVVGFKRDLSAQRSAQVELERRARHQTTVMALLRLGLDVAPLPALLDRALEVVLALGDDLAGGEGGPLAAIVLDDEAAEGTRGGPATLALVATRGPEVARAALSARLAARTCACGGPVGHRDLRRPPEGDARCVPLGRGERVIGALVVGWRDAAEDPGPLLHALGDAVAGLVERAWAEEARHRSEARLRELAANLPGVVYQFVLRPDGTRAFPYVSEGAGALLGIAPEDLARDPDLAFRRVDPRDLAGLEAAIEASARSLGPLRHEFRMVTPGGTRWQLALSTPRRLPSGAILWDALIFDISERKGVEEALERAKAAAEAANRAKSRFLANMSHEIRTPLNAVIGTTGLLLDGPLAPGQRELGEVIRRSGDALLVLVDDVLDFSRIESGRLELEARPFDPHDVVARAADAALARAAEKGLTLALRIAPGVPRRVVGDDVRVRQVLSNLLGNAVKFTARGGVTLEVSTSPADDGRVGLVLAVADTGIGVPADRLDRLFRPFSQVDASTTRPYGGTGLGLAISRRLAELMGGTLEVVTAQGRGSTFTLRIPVVLADGADEAAPAPASLAAPARGLRVLLAEDNAVNRTVALRMLARLGHAADVATTGREVLEALGRASYDVVLMDVHMPEMDGLEAARHVHAGWPDDRRPWVVAMTADALEGDRERCLAAGMDDYLSKPVRLDVLAAALQRCPVRPIAAAPPSLEPTVVATLRFGPPGGPDLLTELGALFLEDAPRALEDMREALTARDPPRLARAAHALKGSCGSIGASAMAAACATLEAIGRAGGLDGAPAALVRLEVGLEAVREALRGP